MPEVVLEPQLWADLSEEAPAVTGGQDPAEDLIDFGTGPEQHLDSEPAEEAAFGASDNPPESIATTATSGRREVYKCRCRRSTPQLAALAAAPGGFSSWRARSPWRSPDEDPSSEGGEEGPGEEVVEPSEGPEAPPEQKEPTGEEAAAEAPQEHQRLLAPTPRFRHLVEVLAGLCNREYPFILVNWWQ